MALRSGYKGFKKMLPGLKILRPGTLGIDNDVLIPELNKTFFPRSEQAVLGARNVAPQYTMASGTVTNGITVTYDANNVVNLNGTASADTYIGLRPRNTGVTLPADARYKVSGRVSADCFTFLLGSDGSTVASSLTEEGSVFDYTSAVANFGFIIYVKNGTVLSNQKVYPMITLASDTDTSFSPPAMTNKELTEKVTINSSQITLSSNVTANNNRVNKQGNVVDLYLYITSMPDTASGDVIIGITPFKPIDDYLFFTVYSTDAPFQPIAGGFIRSNNGEIVIKSGAMNTKTSCYILCTYICQ